MEKELTKIEFRLMNVLWDKKEAFVCDIIDALPYPKPANSTVSTMMRILVNKGFVSYQLCGKSNRYYPIISKEEYTLNFMSHTKNNLFGGSFRSMMSFFAESENLSQKDIDELIEILNECKK